MKTFFHYCSKGLKSDLLFATPKEYIAGMNRVAICYLISEKNSRKVLVISYCLMDNHVHFILYGTREACDVFVADIQLLPVNHCGRKLPMFFGTLWRQESILHLPDIVGEQEY